MLAVEKTNVGSFLFCLNNTRPQTYIQIGNQRNNRISYYNNRDIVTP